MKANTRLNKARFDWTVLFCLFILLVAPASSYFWYLIPVSVSFLVQLFGAPAFILAFLSFFGAVSSPIWLKVGFSALDLLGICLLFLQGVVLVRLRELRQNFMQFIPWVLGFVCVFLATLIGILIVREPAWAYIPWAQEQMNSEIFPAFFRNTHYPEAIRYVFEEFTGPILRSGLLAWFASLMTTSFVINGLTENLLKSFRASNIRGQARAFDRFNRWRATEYVLIPAALGVLILAIDYSLNPDPVFWRQLAGWNLLILGLLPIFIQGLAVVAFLLPRVNIIALIGLVFLLFFNPIPVLVLAGLADLWFDLRSKIERMPPNDDNQAEF